MSIFCCRSGENLNEADLKAHLASLLRVENVGVLLGAGASIGAGGKSMKDLWMCFIQDSSVAARNLADQKFIEQDQNDSDLLENGLSDVPNVEQLLDALEIARIDWKRRDPQSEDLSQLTSDIAALKRCVVKAAILDEALWTSSNTNSEQLKYHKSLMQKMVGARQPGQASPWIFTTNYDLAIEWSAESVGIQINTGFLGIHNRLFSPQSFDLGFRHASASGEARFGCNDCYLVKLHGSLTWKKESGMDFRELSSHEMWPFLERVLEGDEIADDSPMVFPRAAKYLQTHGYLLGELFRRFSDFLARPQTAIFVSGYSFGDEHLNRLLKSALLNPTLQIVAFVPEFDGAGSACLRTNHALRALVELQSPRITFVGGGPAAWFDKFAGYLPDPIFFDLTEREMKERLEDSNERRPNA
ncbi:MAG: SIR2 family protein [Verrucomicrobia bacterium]|nr:SIR2 family protein [Verrucomicrobiota bacterium]